MKRITVRAGVAVLGAIALAVPAMTGTASAQAGSNANATGLIINGGRIAPADCPPGGGTTAPGGPFGLVTVGALTADCTNAGAEASAATVTVGTLQLGLVQSQCTTGPTGTASSSVAVISGAGALDNTIVTNTVPIDIGVATVVLNEPINEPGFRGFNALRITLLGQTIIVGQSRCSTAAAYPLQADLSVGTDTDGGSMSPVSQDAGGAPSWLFWLAAAVLIVAAQATFLPGLLRRRRASHG
ncbi:MAG: hypothetical protein M3163_01305 [Actinomycetota bacterium]|nr:hypothetical protein [Actinomycetota bacterium]